jgi:hypothetical protein
MSMCVGIRLYVLAFVHKFLGIMGNRVGRSTLFGIPLQQQWSYRISGDNAPTYSRTLPTRRRSGCRMGCSRSRRARWPRASPSPLHVLHVNKSPTASNFGYYAAGQTGTTVSLGTDILL